MLAAQNQVVELSSHKIVQYIVPHLYKQNWGMLRLENHDSCNCLISVDNAAQKIYKHALWHLARKEKVSERSESSSTASCAGMAASLSMRCSVCKSAHLSNLSNKQNTAPHPQKGSNFTAAHSAHLFRRNTL